MTTRETLKSFLNKAGKTSNKISYKVNPASGDPNDTTSLLERGQSDLGIDPNTGMDLINFDNGKSLLNDYLSELTKDNEYSISPGASKGSLTNRGQNLSHEHGENNKFVQDSKAEETLSSYSNSKQFTNLSDIIDKTSKSFTNHNVLKDIPGSDLDDSGKTLIGNTSDNITLKSVESVLNNSNRFTSTDSGHAYAPRGTSEDELEKGENKGSHLIQNKYGKFDKNELKYSLNDLKKVGLSMLYKASGYDQGEIPGESLDPEILDAATGAGSIASGDASAEYITSGKFTKINFNDLRALNAATAPQVNKRPFNEDPEIVSRNSGKNSKTYGTTYNSSLHFEGKNSAVLSAKTAIACKAVVSIASDFYETIKRSISRSPDVPNPEFAAIESSKLTTGPFFLGRSRGVLNSNLDLIKKTIIVKTKYNYTDCIDAGIKLFFGDIDNPDSIPFVESPGFLLAISLSAIKDYEDKIRLISEKNINSPKAIASSIISMFKQLKDNQLIKFLNVIATMGDIALASSGGNKDINKKGTERNVDALSDLPGNRPGKFRKKSGRTNKEVAWNSNETPSAYILPLNVVRASAKLAQGNNSPNVTKGMLGSGIYKNTYLDANNDGAASRIPNEVVKEIEDRLDAEYVPFYIQDLRTNEIISFHAFLSSLSDTITPNFNASTGYGRMDSVQIYTDTKRSVNVSFTLLATNREDFDEMWYKINKIITLLYPQWSQGTKVSNHGDNVFIQPFSQVIGASPIVRLRVGDVIKSNYSRFNFARIFGIGDPNINAKPVKTGATRFMSEESIAGDIDEFAAPIGEGLEQIQELAIKSLAVLFGSPMQLMNIGNVQDTVDSHGGFKPGSALQETISTLLTNGFVNPLLEAAILSKIQSPNVSIANLNGVKLFGEANARDIVSSLIDNPDFNNIINFVGSTFQSLEVKANRNTGYQTTTQQKIFLSKNTKVNELEEKEENGQIIYKVKISDSNSKYVNTEIYVQFTDLYFTPEYLFRASGIGNLFYLAEGVESFADEGIDILQEQSAKFGATPGLADLVKNVYKKNEILFMEPENNPYVRAYESTKGRGLAGVLGGVTFDWLNQKFPWEIDHNSRAPMGCNISFSLSVIHDIPPGMDHSGYNRAPLYNVGNIMKNIAGDPHNDGGSMSKFRYDTGREDKKSGE
jgi:hypothetical protein